MGERNGFGFFSTCKLFAVDADWYNFVMPTPFYHLSVANTLINQSSYRPGIKDVIKTYQSTFLLGHVAPDIRVISGQAREITHFYKFPESDNDLLPWERMQKMYPAPNSITHSSVEYAVFLAGYLCHLQADWLWIKTIYEPYFISNAHWGTFSKREYMHNVLRSYLDLQVMESIRRDSFIILAQANPKPWLPFLDNSDFFTWRDFLVNQLKPGAPIKTIEIFASRQGISVENYYRLLNQEDEIQDQIFSIMPKNLTDEYWQELLAKNIDLLNDFLGKV
ncbi:MAG: zinc dependent phospholipase C family protein [Anaerolineales bacterium]